MSAPHSSAVQCTLAGVEKLPAAIRDGDALCARIRSAISERGIGSASIAVRIQGPSRISAIATLSDGRALPQQNVAVSDAELSERSIAMLAKALADQIEGATRR